MSEPLISVIIPAYNAEKRLNTCLESVCRQSWDKLEIIVIDDGSTDGTLGIAREWEKKDPRIRVAHQENSGVSAARNWGLDNCRGEWVRFVDADDLLPEDSIKNLYIRAEEGNSDLVMGGYEHCVGDFSQVRNLANRDDTISCDEYLVFLNKYATSFFCGVLWNKLFRRELIERQKVRFRSGLSYGEDFYFVCEYLKEAKRVSFTTAVVYRYVRHPHSLTVSQSMDSVIHPIRNLKVKWRLYLALKSLYQHRGKYEEYRKVLWKYMVRFTLNQ